MCAVLRDKYTTAEEFSIFNLLCYVSSEFSRDVQDMCKVVYSLSEAH